MDEALTTRVLPAHGGQLSVISASFSVPMDRLLDFEAVGDPVGFGHLDGHNFVPFETRAQIDAKPPAKTRSPSSR